LPVIIYSFEHPKTITFFECTWLSMAFTKTVSDEQYIGGGASSIKFR